jgi:DtxR family Mn-dependent transcriptional regulator
MPQPDAHPAHAPSAPGPAQGAAARYLEAAFYLDQEGEQVRPGKLAEWLGVSPPSVSEALRRLERDGLVRIDQTHRVAFTAAGRAVAADIVRRHRVLEVWLTEVLGFDWVTADREAHQLAAALSGEVLDRLQHSLGDPLTCPHGNVIPGAPVPTRTLRLLAELAPGTPARLARVSELAEHEAPAVLTFLFDAGLVPGRGLEVVSPLGGNGVLEVRLDDGRRAHLSAEVAAALWVDDPVCATT